MIRLLAARVPHPVVIFSLMPTRPHQRDSNPDGVLVWEAYRTETGGIAHLPPHAVVTSSAHDRVGNQKTSHYALVCGNPIGLRESGGGELNISTLRNFGDGGRPIGPSQVTAVVERITGHNGGNLHYPITARATLVAPFAVKLLTPRLLSPREKRLLDQVSVVEGKDAADWMAVVKQLRHGLPERSEFSVTDKSCHSNSTQRELR
jgi:hypothetical protein